MAGERGEEYYFDVVVAFEVAAVAAAGVCEIVEFESAEAAAAAVAAPRPAASLDCTVLARHSSTVDSLLVAAVALNSPGNARVL